jgi:hypothetical protein
VFFMAPWRQLVRFAARIDQRRYFATGIALAALKLLGDWSLASAVGLPWSPGLYLLTLPVGRGDEPVAWRWLLLAAWAVPFLWLGAAATVARLRDADLPVGMVAIFVLPIVNLVLFAVLLVMPTIPPRTRPAALPAERARQRRHMLPPAAAGALVVLLAGTLAIHARSDYGLVLFLGVPFVQGFTIGAMTCDRSWGNSFRQLLIAAGICMAAFLVFGAEGLACIAMAAPIWLAFGTLGLAIGRSARQHPNRAIAATWLALPLAQGLAELTAPPPALHQVTTELLVRADPQRVWDSLVTFEQLPPPEEWLFRAGIAYPTHATIEGRGAGAIRRCSFNTGDFVEPIEVWDEPRLLRFTVDASPQPMIEWNPFHDHVDAPHLHGFFAAKRGQFELVPAGSGQTRLIGTTWYQHGLRPEAYWRWWSDWMLHAIHRRVLQHIQRTAERPVAGAAATPR